MPLWNVLSEHGALELKSFPFVLFVALFIIIYFLLQNTKIQKYFILLADLCILFVMSGFVNLFVVMGICLCVYLSALGMDKYKKDKKKVNLCFWFGILADLGTLLTFKYYSVAFNSIMNAISGNGNVEIIHLIAPIGLSYYTLSMATYLVDVKHKKCSCEKSYLDLLSFALYFPAIIEGPFSLYKKLSPQLKENHYFDIDRLRSGFLRILWGFFLKNVIADRTGILVNGILADEAAVGITVFVGMFLYSFQLYADFGGGINVIMGISEIMGIELAENFKSPLVSKSVTEYWQRWHMTLGTVMEKYVYYPMVLGKTMRNLSKKLKNEYLKKVLGATLANFLVFILVGIWHGTGWNYVVYGLYQAFFTSMAIFCKPVYNKMKEICRINEEAFSWKLFTVVRTFVILIIGRMFIKTGELSQAFTLIKRLFTKFNPYALFDGSMLQYLDNQREAYLIILGVIIMFFVDIMHDRGFRFRKWIAQKDIIFRYAFYVFAFFVIIILGIYGDNTPYIYAQY